MLHKYLPTQPYMCMDIMNYFRILNKNEFSIDRQYLPRFLYTSMLSLLITTPLSKLEHLLKDKKIEQNDIAVDPIFIIGHWRTGTTFLHNLITQDSNLAYLNTSQSICPEMMFFPLTKYFVQLHLPKTRPMDDIQVNWRYPQEDELALLNLSQHSCYHWWAFPKKMRFYFDKYVLLNNLTEQERTQFKKNYHYLIKKISLINGKKRLVLKNPANTGRIPLLLDLFPSAKFIYLHRNPRDVYHSTLKLHTKMLEKFSFQEYSRDSLKRNTQQFYKEVIEKYDYDKTLIPENNLIEIPFNELTQFPMETLQSIYSKLNIPNFENSSTEFQSFVLSQSAYKKDTYS